MDMDMYILGEHKKLASLVVVVIVITFQALQVMVFVASDTPTYYVLHSM